MTSKSGQGQAKLYLLRALILGTVTHSSKALTCHVVSWRLEHKSSDIDQAVEGTRGLRVAMRSAGRGEAVVEEGEDKNTG